MSNVNTNSYAEPPGCREWAVLPYDLVRRPDDPDGLLLEFLQSTYEAAATTAHRDRAALERP